MTTKSENSEIAVLQEAMTNVKNDLTEIKRDIKDLIRGVSDLSKAQTEIGQLRDQVSNLKTEIEELRGVNNLKNTLLWVGLVASAIINIVVIYQLYTEV